MSQDLEIQPIYDELVKRGLFKDDPELQQIGHELRRRGIIVDPSQGGLYNPSQQAQAAPVAPPKTSAPPKTAASPGVPPPTPPTPKVDPNLGEYIDYRQAALEPKTVRNNMLNIMMSTPQDKWDSLLQTWSDAGRKFMPQIAREQMGIGTKPVKTDYAQSNAGVNELGGALAANAFVGNEMPELTKAPKTRDRLVREQNVAQLKSNILQPDSPDQKQNIDAVKALLETPIKNKKQRMETWRQTLDGLNLSDEDERVVLDTANGIMNSYNPSFTDNANNASRDVTGLDFQTAKTLASKKNVGIRDQIGRAHV